MSALSPPRSLRRRPGGLATLATLLALSGVQHAAAATLRPFVTVAAGVVRLSDLFDGLGAGDDRPLGPAPAPGSRITVEAPQLKAIADQFGVDWHASSPSDRAVLERDGRPLTREALLAIMRPALAAAGAPADAELDLGGFTPPMLPVDSAKLDVSQLDYDAPTGRFTAMLVVASENAEPQRLRLVGSVAAMMELPVLLHRFAPGSIVEAGDIQVTRVRAGLVHGTPAMVAAQVVGMVTRRAIAAGQPIALADLARPFAVDRGASVQLLLDTAGLTLTAQGQALDSGAPGEHIRVLNPVSHAVLLGIVEASGRVRVTPGSMPLSLAARSYAGVNRQESLR